MKFNQETRQFGGTYPRIEECFNSHYPEVNRTPDLTYHDIASNHLILNIYEFGVVAHFWFTSNFWHLFSNSLPITEHFARTSRFHKNYDTDESRNCVTNTIQNLIFSQLSFRLAQMRKTYVINVNRETEIVQLTREKSQRRRFLFLRARAFLAQLTIPGFRLFFERRTEWLPRSKLRESGVHTSPT